MNKKTLSYMMAAMLLFSGGGKTNVSKAETKLLDTTTTTEKDSISKVKEYFGWENFNGTVDTTGLRFLYVDCDNEKKYFLLGKSENNVEKTLFDPVTLEDVFVYNGQLMDNKNIKPTEYFANGEKFENFGSYNFTFSNFTEKEYYYYKRTNLPIDEYAQMILKINPDLNIWYSKKNVQPSLEDLNYFNIIPNYNDDNFILKNQILVIEGFMGKPLERTMPIVITERKKVTNEEWEYRDIFSGELIAKEREGSKILKYFTTQNADKKIWEIETLIDNFTWGPNRDVHLTRALRECTEIIDGIEYMSVGKLRKVYENIRPEKQLDYSMYFDKQNIKPGSTNLDNMTLTSIVNKPKLKELTKKS